MEAEDMIAQIIETLQILVWLHTASTSKPHFETVFAFANIKKKKTKVLCSGNCKQETEAI